MERYKKECQKINEQINPSDEFIQNLKTNLNQKIAEKEKRRCNLSKVAAIFITLTLVSTGAFAKDIGNWFSRIFSNVDESVQVAIEHGFVQNVDMDYIEHDGIAIKVNSLIIDDNKINIVFDVKGEIEGDLLINDFKLSGDSDEYQMYNNEIGSVGYRKELKQVSKNYFYLIMNIYNIEQSLNIIDKINICLNGLSIINEEGLYKKNESKWEFYLDIKDKNYKNLRVCKYEIKENEFVNSSEIKVSNTGANLNINFKDNFEQFKLITKESISVETDSGEVFVCRDVCRIENNTIKMNIPLTVYNETENLKIKIKLPDEEIVLNAYKIDNSQDV